MYFVKADGQQGTFASLYDEPTKFLTLVVPAYNEEKRMGVMLDEMMGVLASLEKTRRGFTYEVIIVNDGSKDGTAAVGQTYVKKYGDDKIRVCNLYKNCGKGGAVRKGMMRARGQYLLMVDADGATKAACLSQMLDSIVAVQKNGLGIAVGSRAHLHEDDSTAKRKWYRIVLMHGFHALVSMVVGGGGIKDTQCGFKLFSRNAGLCIFPYQHIERWAFDVELLFLGNRQGVPMVEVPVEWEEVDGSKVDVLADTISMARDLIMIRLCYLFRVWTYTAGPGKRSVLKKSD